MDIPSVKTGQQLYISTKPNTPPPVPCPRPHQTDIKLDGRCLDKSHLCNLAAEASGSHLLFHKVACIQPPGCVTGGRPRYSHLLAFSREARADDVASLTADVLPSRGAMLWARGMGLDACLAACRFVQAAHGVRARARAGRRRAGQPSGIVAGTAAAGVGVSHGIGGHSRSDCAFVAEAAAVAVGVSQDDSQPSASAGTRAATVEVVMEATAATGAEATAAMGAEGTAATGAEGAGVGVTAAAGVEEPGMGAEGGGSPHLQQQLDSRLCGQDECYQSHPTSGWRKQQQEGLTQDQGKQQQQQQQQQLGLTQDQGRQQQQQQGLTQSQGQQQLLQQKHVVTIINPFCGEGTILAVANWLGMHTLGMEWSHKRGRLAAGVMLSRQREEER